jgi:DNA primase
MVSEDISKVNTADTVLTYSQTEQEHRVRMARLYVDYARNAERGTTILMSQSYATGQYVLDSALMQNVYWERLKQVTGEDVDQDDSSGSD